VWHSCLKEVSAEFYVLRDSGSLPYALCIPSVSIRRRYLIVLSLSLSRVLQVDVGKELTIWLGHGLSSV